MATTTPKSKSSMKNLPSNPSSSSQVRVVLRVRPFLPSEIETEGKKPISCINILDPERHPMEEEEVAVHIKDQYTSRNECYKLDSFFDQEEKVGRIFQEEVKRVIPHIFRGLNATIFAYGATGSGKTYTMQGTEDEPGLIPLAMSTILSLCRNTWSTVEISYYEVYMDRCYDLLEPKASEIIALDDKDGNVQLKGLSWVTVRSMDEFSEIFSSGVQRRKVAHTGLNDVSSRSHGVLAIAVRDGSVTGKLNLIDLAGNEDNRRTCNEGIRLKESAKINQSLFALSNVIYALNNNESRIPYRASKLTRILQDSLGGTSQALMIACLNPISYQEAVHTVSLAARSRQIVNHVGSASKRETPKVKVDMEAKLQTWLESKGKNRSIQRTVASPSPSLGRASARSSLKAKPMNRGDLKENRRKLFNLWPTTTEVMEANMMPIVSAVKDASLLGDENRPCEVEVSQYDNMLCDESYNLKSGTSQFDGHALVDQNQVDKNLLEQSEDQDVTYQNNYSSTTEDVNGQKVLLSPDGSDQLDKSMLGFLPAQRSDDAEDHKSTTHVKILKTSDFLGTPSNKENPKSFVNSLGSPLNNDKIQELENSLRKVLSPISSNTSINKHISHNDRLCVILFEPKTPKTPYFTPDMDVQMTGTPLDKFNTLGSHLKDSLAQEYLAFLNVASKEELLQLKGIGQKRAEYILQLREETPKPLKSLSDLEKIGLSSKQVDDMFRRAARGIF